MRPFLILLVTLSLSSCITYEALEPEAHGKIVDSTTKTPLGGASVKLNNTRSIITEDDGIFYFPERKGFSFILPASHRFLPTELIIQKPGYHPAVVTFFDSTIPLTKKAAEQGAAANP